jgi:hypothetical protein
MFNLPSYANPKENSPGGNCSSVPQLPVRISFMDYGENNSPGVFVHICLLVDWAPTGNVTERKLEVDKSSPSRIISLRLRVSMWLDWLFPSFYMLLAFTLPQSCVLCKPRFMSSELSDFV